jgi:hypothetical protein
MDKQQQQKSQEQANRVSNIQLYHGWNVVYKLAGSSQRKQLWC